MLISTGNMVADPVKALHPILEELSKEYSGKIDIYQIDVDQEQDLAAGFRNSQHPYLADDSDERTA